MSASSLGVGVVKLFQSFFFWGGGGGTRGETAMPENNSAGVTGSVSNCGELSQLTAQLAFTLGAL